MTKGKLQSWLAAHPDETHGLVGTFDFNGVMRGKYAPISSIEAAYDGDFKMPLTLLGVDIWGMDALESGEVFDTGDKDGLCMPTERGPIALPWQETTKLFLPVSLYTDNQTPYPADPRHILKSVVDKYAELSWTPVCAAELEFSLYDLSSVTNSTITPPAHAGGASSVDKAIYAIREIERFSPFIEDVYACCASIGVPADTAIAESGKGQFEINLRHSPDPLRVADDAIFLKHIVKTVARRHGFGATFMAKPYGEDSGNGFHVHVSLLDKAGANLFNDGTDEGSEYLLFAVNGLLEAMSDDTLLFAPHYNSYRRLQPEAHAPIGIAWSYENRTSAIRIPSSKPDARRFEHRVSGADASPYLVLAAVLRGALDGLCSEEKPPAPVTGNAYALDLQTLPTTWNTAIQNFAASKSAKKAYGELFHKMFLAAKRQEYSRFMAEVSAFEYQTYLENV